MFVTLFKNFMYLLCCGFLHAATIDIATVEVPLTLEKELKPFSYKLDAYGNIRIALNDTSLLPNITKVKQEAESTF